MLPVAGALLGAELVGGFEAVGIRGQVHASLGDLACGDAAVLVPIATIVGVLLAGASMLVGLRTRSSMRTALGGIIERTTRARWAAGALITPPALLGWALVCAHGARTALANGSPVAVGVEMAAVSVSSLVIVGCAVWVGIPLAARTVTATVGPFVAFACGASFALACSTVGVRLGDPSGNGPTPLAILGVLARRELDLSPVIALAVIAACALVGALAAHRGGAGRVAVGSLVVVLGWGLLIREAYALTNLPEVARAIELGAPQDLPEGGRFFAKPYDPAVGTLDPPIRPSAKRRPLICFIRLRAYAIIRRDE